MPPATVELRHEQDFALSLPSQPILHHRKSHAPLYWSGGRNDPMVVSDDDSQDDERAGKYRTNSFLFELSRQRTELAHQFDIPSVVIDATADDYMALLKRYEAAISSLKYFKSRGQGSEKDYSSLLDWFGVYAAQNISGFCRALSETSFTELVREYSALASEVLEQAGFSESDPYTDSLGGSVLDFFKSEARITIIVTKSDVQVLTYVNGEIQSKLLEDPRRSKVEVATFISSLTTDG